MDFVEKLIYVGIFLLIIFLITPIPYCKETKKIVVGDAIYTTGEISEITNISLILLEVKGTSMLPTIKNNSECFCVEKEDYFIGDIIFFFAKIGDVWKGITHRIVDIENNEYFTKGDGNDFTDPPMTKESIVCSIPYVPRYRTIF